MATKAVAVPIPLGGLAPIQTIPQGLLSLLQLKQFGLNPRELKQDVQPILDLFPFYVQRLNTELVQGGTDTFALPTASPGLQLFATTLNQNVAAWVERMTIFGTLLAAETLVVAPAILTGAGDAHLVGPTFSDVITARARAFRVTASNFWMGPGSRFAFEVFDDLTAGSITISLAARGFTLTL